MMRDKSGVFVAIGDFIAKVAGEIKKVRIEIAIGILQAQVARLEFQVASLFSTVKKLSSLVGRALKHILSDIIHLRFLHLWQDYLTLKAKLKAWFEKHLKWLLELRRRFDIWFRRTIVPILNLIQRIRAILAVFRIFHFKFAAKLDALLGRLESKIIKNTLILRQKVNQIASIIELVLDPSLIIRRNVLLASLLAQWRRIRAALGIPVSRPLTPQEEKRQKEDRELLKKGTVLVSGGATPEFHPAIARILCSIDEESKVYL